MEKSEKKKHLMNLLIQILSGIIVVVIVYFVSKFVVKKKEKLPELPQQASDILKVGVINKKTGKMNVMYNYKTAQKHHADRSFGNDLFEFTLEAEGGLSKDKNDSAYKEALKLSDFPKEGFHTNMGITFTTFKDASKKLNFDGSYKNFLSMPMNIWKLIFDELYYKPFKSLSNSPLINYTVTEWAWGSGVSGAKKSFANFLKNENVKTIQELQKKYKPLELFEKLVLHRIKFFESISQPPIDPVTKKPFVDKNGKIIPSKNARFLDGWKNRAANYYNIFSYYA